MSRVFKELEFLGFDPNSIRNVLRTHKNFDEALKVLSENKEELIKSQLVSKGVPMRMAKRLSVTCTEVDQAMNRFNDYVNNTAERIRDGVREMGFSEYQAEWLISEMVPFEEAIERLVSGNVSDDRISIQRPRRSNQSSAASSQNISSQDMNPLSSPYSNNSSQSSYVPPQPMRTPPPMPNYVHPLSHPSVAPPPLISQSPFGGPPPFPHHPLNGPPLYPEYFNLPAPRRPPGLPQPPSMHGPPGMPQPPVMHGPPGFPPHPNMHGPPVLHGPPGMPMGPPLHHYQIPSRFPNLPPGPPNYNTGPPVFHARPEILESDSERVSIRLPHNPSSSNPANQGQVVNLNRNSLGPNFNEAYENAMSLTLNQNEEAQPMFLINLPAPLVELMNIDSFFRGIMLIEILSAMYQEDPGLGEEAINGLKKEAYRYDLGITNDTCPICQEEFVVGVEMIPLKCKHGFHDECIKTWLQRSTLCPLCKSDLQEEGH
jgi:hypothetical protein